MFYSLHAHAQWKILLLGRYVLIFWEEDQRIHASVDRMTGSRLLKVMKVMSGISSFSTTILLKNWTTTGCLRNRSQNRQPSPAVINHSRWDLIRLNIWPECHGQADHFTVLFSLGGKGEQVEVVYLLPRQCWNFLYESHSTSNFSTNCWMFRFCNWLTGTFGTFSAHPEPFFDHVSLRRNWVLESYIRKRIKSN